jgi:WD40 repeat protein
LAAASAARAKDGDAGDAPVDIDEQEAPGWRGAFSAQWDPNNPRQLYVCSQNGLLKVVDVESAKEKTYQVLFRTFSASIISGSQTECKPLRYHWDKMSIVYGKPGEFFFLMGVSNTVYFSALPGSGSVLASLTNADMPDFVNGTPVLQIYSHASRVTAMASCPVAEVFVSGDESGELSVISFIPDPANKLKSEWWSSPSATPNHLNPLVRAHNAPIFSLVWLSVLHVEKNRDRVVYMASGSEDRMVKLWKVTCDLQKSVAVTPLMVLDTISTHMLSLACLPHYRDGMSIRFYHE